MVVDAGSITLGVGLGFLSVALGILSLVVKSECSEVNLCWGAIHCTKQRHRRDHDDELPRPPPVSTV